jgi:hypothetical protein
MRRRGRRVPGFSLAGALARVAGFSWIIRYCSFTTPGGRAEITRPGYPGTKYFRHSAAFYKSG